MKSLLILVSVLCLALIVSGRPTDDGADQESSTELSEDTSDQTHEDEGAAETSDTDAETGDGETEDSGAGEEDAAGTDSDADTEGDDSETGGDGGDSESASEEGAEGSDDTVSGADDKTEDTKDDAEGDSEGDEGESGGEGGAEESPRNTYRQVHKLLKQIMKVDTKDKYLKSFVVGRLQERLMNPTIDLVSTIEKYSKIKECFSSLEKDVSALVKDSEKSYEECAKDKNNPNCGQEGTRELDEGLIEREQELSDCIVEKRDAE